MVFSTFCAVVLHEFACMQMLPRAVFRCKGQMHWKIEEPLKLNFYNLFGLQLQNLKPGLDEVNIKIEVQESVCLCVYRNAFVYVNSSLISMEK